MSSEDLDLNVLPDEIPEYYEDVIIPREIRDKAQRENIEIRTTRDGRMFGIRNLRQEFEGNKMILKAEITGDIKAGKEYLKFMGKSIINNVTSWSKKVNDLG